MMPQIVFVTFVLVPLLTTCNCLDLTRRGKDIDTNNQEVSRKSKHEFLKWDGNNTTKILPNSLAIAKSARANVPVQNSCNCGIRDEATARIIGGSRADKNEFPWRCNLMAASQREFSANYSGLQYTYNFFCGCTILSSRWILTAAHCTVPPELKGRVYVFAGDTKLSPPEDGSGQLVAVKNIFYHPEYNASDPASDNDISLLELSKDLEFGANLKPACLPYKFLKSKFYQQTGTVSGWGVTKYRGKISQVLRKLDLPILTTKQCRKYYKSIGNITDNMFCTYAPKKDSCQGDSGGSLDYRDPESGRYFAIGVVSWGIRCALPNKPGVYGKVKNFLKYIEKTSGIV